MEWHTGDMIDACKEFGAQGIVFTANSVITNQNGMSELVMGLGAAKRVRDFFPSAPRILAQEIKQTNARIQPDYHLAGFYFTDKNLSPFYIFALQVKRDFKNNGDLALTIESLQILADWCIANPDVKLIMNCPLIGLGGFSDQEEDIKNIVEKILFNANVVVTTL